MKKYRISILIASILITPLAVFDIYLGVHKGSLLLLSIATGMFLIPWGSYYFLRRESPISFWITFVIVNIVWWPLLLRTVQRITFVIENGGMERVDGSGSPVAFLLGLCMEQIFFAPLTISMIFGVPLAIVLTMRSKKGPPHSSSAF